jgi:hypothetical protein
MHDALGLNHAEVIGAVKDVRQRATVSLRFSHSVATGCSHGGEPIEQGVDVLGSPGDAKSGEHRRNLYLKPGSKSVVFRLADDKTVPATFLFLMSVAAVQR